MLGFRLTGIGITVQLGAYSGRSSPAVALAWMLEPSVHTQTVAPSPPIVGKYLCLLLGWMKWGSQFQESFQLGSISYFFVLYSINDKMTLNVHDFFP